jgi:uncharacterized Fe-S center protein
MSSKVYFTPIHSRSTVNSLQKKVTELYDVAGFSDCISKDDLVAVKLHFGEDGNTAFVQADYVKKVVARIKKNGGKPFLTDANTLYHGTRSNAIDHINTAHKHGFTQDNVGAQVIIADGLKGKDVIDVKVGLKHFKEVKLGAAAVHADALMVVTHFKGHIASGFGGTLKNVGMGFGSRAGKQLMHSDIKPKVNRKKCVGCATCVMWCPRDAITLKNGKATISQKLCYGCAECFITCKPRAIEIRWDTSSEPLQEKMVEYTVGVLKNKKGKAGYFSFVNNVTKHCDCVSWTDPPFVKDIGILASKDPVALDKASADLVNRVPLNPECEVKAIEGKDNLRAANDVDWSHQLKYAEKVGLGTRIYELIEI